MGKNKQFYALSNPMWLSDTFICAKIKDWDKYCYLKINLNNTIEEIGVDLEKRLHVTNIEDMKRFYVPITKTLKMRFNSISDELWWRIIRDK